MNEKKQTERMKRFNAKLLIRTLCHKGKRFNTIFLVKIYCKDKIKFIFARFQITYSHTHFITSMKCACASA